MLSLLSAVIEDAELSAEEYTELTTFVREKLCPSISQLPLTTTIVQSTPEYTLARRPAVAMTTVKSSRSMWKDLLTSTKVNN